MADKTLFVKIKSIFSPAQSRANITSGENLETSLSKISKWFSDIGSAAFKDVPSSGDAGSGEVVLGNDSRLSDARTPTAHNQPSSTITAMTGYSKPQATSAITASDTLNEAIGKLEKGLDGAGGGLQPGNVDVSTNSVTLTSSSPTATVTLSNATGAVSILCSAENFEATLSGNTITINRTGINDEEDYVLITVASDSTHSSNIIAISVHNQGIILCTWSGGSDEAVASMIQAAHNGDINLKDYWSVGDVRTIANLDTSVISTSTISLRLYNGAAYNDNDAGKISNFCIGVEGTSTYTPNSLFVTSQSGWGNEMILSFGKASLIARCLPQSLKNCLLTQVITNQDSYGGADTQRTLYSYGGEIVHSSSSRSYGTNRTNYSNYNLDYYYYTYGNNWVRSSIPYNNTSRILTATYLMHI